VNGALAASGLSLHLQSRQTRQCLRNAILPPLALLFAHRGKEVLTAIDIDREGQVTFGLKLHLFVEHDHVRHFVHDHHLGVRLGRHGTSFERGTCAASLFGELGEYETVAEQEGKALHFVVFDELLQLALVEQFTVGIGGQFLKV
jgi:hypothetical protein